MDNILTSNDLSDINNYNDDININVSILFLKYVGIIHNLISSIVENINVKDLEYLKYILIKGIKNTTYIYTFLLLYTKNINLTVYHTERNILYYVEFIGQINLETNNFLKLSINDASLFIYKRTIFDIDCEFRKNYIETPKTKNIIDLLHQYINIYNNILIMYINTFDFYTFTTGDLQKNIFTKLYKISERLIQIPSFCKNTNISEHEAIKKITVMVSEIDKFHHCKIIKNNYFIVVNYIIKKFLSKPINIDGFINKINGDHFEERIKNMSITRMVNYLTLH